MSVEMAKRKAFLLKLIREKERALEKAPEGYLRTTMSHGVPRYYHVQPTNGSSSGTYLGKKKLRLAKRLAQKGYDQAVLDAAVKELRALETYEKKMPERAAEDVFQALPAAPGNKSRRARRTCKEKKTAAAPMSNADVLDEVLCAHVL